MSGTREIRGRDVAVGDDIVFLGNPYRVVELRSYVPSDSASARGIAVALGPSRIAYVRGYDTPFMTVRDGERIEVAA